MLTVVLDSDEGDVLISEDELATIPHDELTALRISRQDLHRVFEIAAELLREHKGELVRPFASQTIDGGWEVRLIAQSQIM